MAMPWTDEEGRYDSYLCKRDSKECRGDCINHRKPVPEWFRDIYNETNRRLNDDIQIQYADI